VAAGGTCVVACCCSSSVCGSITRPILASLMSVETWVRFLQDTSGAQGRAASTSVHDTSAPRAPFQGTLAGRRPAPSPVGTGVTAARKRQATDRAGGSRRAPPRYWVVKLTVALSGTLALQTAVLPPAGHMLTVDDDSIATLRCRTQGFCYV